MTLQDHARLCNGSGGIVVETIGAGHQTVRCDSCGRLVTSWSAADAARRADRRDGYRDAA